jgi:plasmid stabilization system protein ParE
MVLNTGAIGCGQGPRALSLVLDLAIKNGRLVRNPAQGTSLPREAQTDRRYLSHEQALGLAEAAGDYRVAVMVRLHRLSFRTDGSTADASHRPSAPPG